MNLGVIYWDLGEIDNSRKSYADALALSERLGIRDDAKKCRLALGIDNLYRLGKDYDRKREYDKSCKAFNDAIALARKLGSPDHEAKCFRWLAIVNLEERNGPAFLVNNGRAVELFKLLKNDRERGYCLLNYGSYYSKYSDISLGSMNALESLLISRASGQVDDEVESLCCLGGLFAGAGYLYKAIDYYLAAEEKIIRFKLNFDFQSFYTNLGVLYRQRYTLMGNRSDLEIALSYYYLALGLAWQNDNAEIEVRILNNIGFTLMHLGKHMEASKFLEYAYARAYRLGNEDLIIMIMTNQGLVYFAQGNLERAVYYFDGALIRWMRNGSSRPPWDAIWGKGLCLERKSRFRDALSAFEDCVEVVSGIRNRLEAEAEKAEYLQSKLIVYDSIIDLIFNQKREWPKELGDKLVFSAMERAKAKSFLEEMKASDSPGSRSANPELAQQEKELSQQISLEIKSLQRSGLSPYQRNQTSIQISHAEDLYVRLKKSGLSSDRIRSRYDSPSLRKIQEYLEESNSVALEFYLGGKCSYVVLVTGHSLQVWPLPSRQDVENSVKLYNRMLTRPPSDGFDITSAAGRIYDELMFPLRSIEPRAIDNLIIVPDGLLNYLPFETLSNRGSLLLEDFSISYVPSLNSLLRLVQPRPSAGPRKDLLAVGDPDYGYVEASNREGFTSTSVLREVFMDEGFALTSLPYTEQEIKGVASLFAKDRVDLFLGRKASEEAIKRQRLADYRVIHFACHGFLDERNPLRSALVLSQTGNGQEDGFFQSREILNLRTEADLVVLSACQTGRGCLERGEGVLGIARVFFYTGSKSVVSALWAINDESTCVLMKEFYAGLKRGLGKSKALREAKLKLIRSGYDHPFYWAPFILNGEYRSAIEFR